MSTTQHASLPGAMPGVIAEASGAGPVAESYEQQAPAIQMMPGNLEALVSCKCQSGRVCAALDAL